MQGGALTEKFNRELQKVLDNLDDPNTDSKKTRTIDLKVKFVPNPKRDTAVVEIHASSKLAPIVPVETTIGIGRDNKGKLMAAEYKNQLPGQLEMQVDEETGEILNMPNDAEIESDNVVDLRKTK